MLRKVPYWDDKIIKELIVEGWSNISVLFINNKVISILQRLQDVIDGLGAMTGHSVGQER